MSPIDSAHELRLLLVAFFCREAHGHSCDLLITDSSTADGSAPQQYIINRVCPLVLRLSGEHSTMPQTTIGHVHCAPCPIQDALCFHMHAAWLGSWRVVQQSFVIMCWMLLQVPHQLH
jgi:hypothetical protein